MIKSKFNIGVSLSIVAIATVGPILLIFLYLNSSVMDVAFNYFALPFVTIGILLIIRIELPKIKRLTISKKSISITSPITGRTKQFEYDEIDGFKTQLQPARIGYNESILLYLNGVCFHEISDLYYSNFSEVKKQLERSITNLGTKEFKYFDYLIERIRKGI